MIGCTNVGIEPSYDCYDMCVSARRCEALKAWEREKAKKEKKNIVIEEVPSTEPKTDDESELRFYYVESIDDYWIGQRLDNFYYADWHDGLGFVWSKSRYLPWGEHIVNEATLWKEHTYPSEPIEIPFTEWIVGFVKKFFAEPKTGKWVKRQTIGDVSFAYCSECGEPILHGRTSPLWNYCHNCGARMFGEDGEA